MEFKIFYLVTESNKSNIFDFLVHLHGAIYIKAFKMVSRYLISDSLQELAIVEFPDENIEFPKSPVSKVFRSMMNESLI